MNAVSRLICFADTPIFSLPGKKVQERSQGLADQAKANPKDAVANHLARHSFDPAEGSGDHDQRELDHHAEKGNTCVGHDQEKVVSRRAGWGGGEGDCRGNPPRMLCVGTPTASSCRMPEKTKTIALAVRVAQPRPTSGEKTWRRIK